ncbi:MULTISPECIES: DUF6950 family protein [unclassified Variovorax]|uniref:DUF6950 family protein n=1 Tax=unclassified Variovorax TaxID=663243 RepID=UPI003F4532EA
MTTRVELDRFIEVRRNVPFEYFTHDCANIAADWVLESTGRDPMADLRGDAGVLSKRRLLPALRLVRAAGGFEAAATARLGTALPGLMAQRGDVVLAQTGGKIGRVSGFGFGICTGPHIVVPGDNGLVFLPLTVGVAAWRV